MYYEVMTGRVCSPYLPKPDNATYDVIALTKRMQIYGVRCEEVGSRILGNIVVIEETQEMSTSERGRWKVKEEGWTPEYGKRSPDNILNETVLYPTAIACCKVSSAPQYSIPGLNLPSGSIQATLSPLTRSLYRLTLELATYRLL